MTSLNTDQVRDAAQKAKKSVVKGASLASESMNDSADQVTDIVATQVEMLRDESIEFLKMAQKSIKKNPLAAVAVAAGVGVLLASVVAGAARGLTRS